MRIWGELQLPHARSCSSTKKPSSRRTESRHHRRTLGILSVVFASLRLCVFTLMLLQLLLQLLLLFLLP